MTDSFSIADLSEEEKNLRLGMYERFMDDSKDMLKKDHYKFRYQYGADEVIQWGDFKDTYADDIKRSFLQFRHAGGMWETYEFEGNSDRDRIETAWRFVEGQVDPDGVEATVRAELEDKYSLKIESNYEPGSSIPDVGKYKIERELADYDDNKGLTPKSEIKKPSVKKFKIPKSVRKYAAGVSSKPANSAKMAIRGLKDAATNYFPNLTSD